MRELKQIKEENKDLEFIFAFVERLATKLIKISVDFPNDDTIVFIDYNDGQEYFVDVNKVNRILDYCFHEYYFKIILSGSEYYSKTKKISLELDIEPYIFDCFFRSFFLAIKQRYYDNRLNSIDFIKNEIDIVIDRAPHDTFLDIPIIDHSYYMKKSKIILSELKKRNLLFFNSNDITKDSRLPCYFPVSCDTFKFYTHDRYKFEQAFPVFEFLDLRVYLNNQNTDLLTKYDKIVHMIVLICFKDVRYLNNKYSDNSYIKNLNIQRLKKNK